MVNLDGNVYICAMKKKVYFAGSIRGGRQDADLYKRIIEYIQRDNIVLTEHIGDLSKSQFEGKEDCDVAIYEQDTTWLRGADVVIAECTTPSLGVDMLTTNDPLEARRLLGEREIKAVQ